LLYGEKKNDIRVGHDESAMQNLFLDGLPRN
jgi:hypothetical protein